MSQRQLAVIAVASFLVATLMVVVYERLTLGRYVLRYRSIHHDEWIPWKWYESGEEKEAKGKRPRHPYAILFERQTEPELERLRRKALILEGIAMAYWMGGGILLLNWLIPWK